ncbi:glutaminase [Bacillus sp. JCM 19045]|uniref:Glutaminase n=1 Tax=Shouchella xiaoxiensis TaxID=766895 RepID=A0ABS2SVP6_9BACI|nr:glutaminase A [Shouchella xiaoxiensis]MBM7839300.1 glutaminase [Shouchella xiaoxiensis]GAF13005.1 glutaminase [Bacillus sp. JCM 19045]
MLCRSNDELQLLVNQAKDLCPDGKVADYIPALAEADQAKLSVALFYPDGRLYSAGDTKENFTLQSISKVLALALALIDHGEEHVFQWVGKEPTGDPFNSIAKLETTTSKPLNPMINAGALAVTHMIKGSSVSHRFERLLEFVRCLSSNKDIDYNEEIAKSEYETAHLNRALAFFMKQHGAIDEKIEGLIDLYTKQCAIEMNCMDLARIGCVFAMDGRDPETDEQLVPLDVARICKTFMVTCGMYNASGEFAINVGIPAKSGVSGGIMGAIPKKCGIGICGPSLDERGNSIAGMKLLEMMSKQYSFSMF